MSELESRARIVGIDVGTKRVGMAVADPLHLFAQTHGTYAPDEALDALRSFVEDQDIDVLVVGWPLTEAGEEGDATEMVQSFIDRVRAVLGEINIVRRDERFTSEIAKDLLRRAGVSQPGRYDKGRVDAVAAAVILQSYLDER